MKRITTKSKESLDFKRRRGRNSKFLKELRKNATKAELIVKEYLESKNIWFIFQKGFLIPFHRIVDFYIPKVGIIIEIDGGYHKDTEDKDSRKDYAWLMRSMKTIRITNEQVYDGTFKELIDSLDLPLVVPKIKQVKVSLGKYGSKYS